jgi:hypothetical protein
MPHPAAQDARRIDWSSLRHAHGTAEDVPDLLDRLASPDEDTADRAHETIAAALYDPDGGAVYPASAEAVFFLVELVADPGTHVPGELMELVERIARAEKGSSETLAGVRVAMALCRERLYDIGMREMGLWYGDHAHGLYSDLAEQEDPAAVVEPLTGLLRDHPLPRVRAAALVALGRLALGDGAWVAAELAEDRSWPVRAAAVRTLARTGLPWPAEATRIVADLCGDPGLLDRSALPFDPFGGPVRGLDGRDEQWEVLDAMLARGGPAARTAARLAYEVCREFRPARARSESWFASAADHPDREVRTTAAAALADLAEGGRQAGIVAAEVAALYERGVDTLPEHSCAHDPRSGDMDVRDPSARWGGDEDPGDIPGLVDRLGEPAARAVPVVPLLRWIAAVEAGSEDGADLESLVPRLRAIVAHAHGDAAFRAGDLVYRRTGDTACLVAGIERGLRHPVREAAARRAGDLGAAAEGVADQLRDFTREGRFGFHPATALYRITGETAALRCTTAVHLRWCPADLWVFQAMERLGWDAEDALDRVREQYEGDRSVIRRPPWGTGVRDDERARAVLGEILARARKRGVR